ncbi:uncharacterized protein LOC118502917 [Anopheles stephensi]|uniref:uncharacterized protein LOC118502917 n=1 Tax=Anopheles stephensi TaxID=30069 RepID=UPI00165895C0|nr:uncharacterized protein LOC118502917 [Anopheles stephensi]
MADGLLQRFSTIGSVIGSSSSSTSMPPMETASITQRIHHETPALLAGGKYPVYGPGTGPDLYDDEASEYWHGAGSNGAGGFFPSFLPWGPGPQGAHPVPPPPPPPPPPPAYPLYRGPYGGPFNKGLRFKGASVAVLTLLAFLFFLSILQNYIRDYSTTSQPTVILLSAGATKENLPIYPYRIRQKEGQRGDEPPSRYDEEVDAPIEEVSEQSEGTTSGYRARIRKGHQRPHQKGSSSSSSSKGVSSGSISAVPSNAPFGDIFKVNGL